MRLKELHNTHSISTLIPQLLPVKFYSFFSVTQMWAVVWHGDSVVGFPQPSTSRIWHNLQVGGDRIEMNYKTPGWYPRRITKLPGVEKTHTFGDRSGKCWVWVWRKTFPTQKPAQPEMSPVWRMDLVLNPEGRPHRKSSGTTVRPHGKSSGGPD